MFDRWFESTRWWWCALSGLLLVLSFAPFSCATCGWIALVPAWWMITRSESVRRQPIRHGYLMGLIYFGGSFWWISNVTVVGAVLLILYLALYPGLWFLLIAKLVRRSESVLIQALAAAALWVMLEWWRNWFLTGFNWNELGDSQAPSIIFRQLAAFGGVPLISFVLVLVNILWAEGLFAMAVTLREKKVVRASFPFAVALVIVALTFALGAHHLRRHDGDKLGPAVRYACIQPNIPQIVFEGTYDEYRKRANEAIDIHAQLSVRALRDNPDLLIWPEATTSLGIFESRDLNETAHALADSGHRYFLLGSQDLEGHKVYNTAYLFGPGWDRYQIYRKTYLVLLGEYLPFGDYFPWFRKLIGIGMDMSPGPGPVRFEMTDPAVTFSPLICFEDTVAVVTDRAARLNPDFFVTITNDGWYQGWCAAWGVRQHLQHAVFRCVEHDRPMIRCTNNGISCEIDQNGTVVDRYRDPAGGVIDVSGIFARKLQFYPPRPTFHEVGGDWIVLISSLATGILGLRFFSSQLFRRP